MESILGSFPLSAVSGGAVDHVHIMEGHGMVFTTYTLPYNFRSIYVVGPLMNGGFISVVSTSAFVMTIGDTVTNAAYTAVYKDTNPPSVQFVFANFKLRWTSSTSFECTGLDFYDWKSGTSVAKSPAKFMLFCQK